MNQRMQKVNELLKREISAVLNKDLEFKDALVTVNSVETNPDLRTAHVYVGFVGSPPAQRDAFELLQKKRTLVQQRIAGRVILRNTPRLEFREDDSIEKGVGLLDLLDEVDQLPTAPPEEVAEE